MPFFCTLTRTRLLLFGRGSWCLPSLVYGSRLVNRHLDRSLFTTLRPAACVESLVHQDQVMGVPYQPRADSYFLLSGLDFNEGSGRVAVFQRVIRVPANLVNQLDITCMPSGTKAKGNSSVTFNTNAQQAGTERTIENGVIGDKSRFGLYLHH